MNATRRARIAFFRRHGGYRVGFSMVDAFDMARAEEWAEANGIEASWENDEDIDTSWMDAETLAGLESGRWDYLCCVVKMGDAIACLGGIVVSYGDPYCRVVEAELFSELLDEVSGHWGMRLQTLPIGDAS